MFFMSTCIYHVCIHIDWITCHIMFESLYIHNLRFGAFKIIDLDSTGPIYFFNMKRSFPSGKLFTWRKHETRSKQQNFITNIKFTFQNSFIVPLLYLFLEHFSALVSSLLHSSRKVKFMRRFSPTNFGSTFSSLTAKKSLCSNSNGK